MWLLANKPVVEEIDIGHLFREKVGRFVHIDGAGRIERNPYLGRTVREMHSSGCCVNDPLSQECLHRLMAVYRVSTSYRVIDTLLVQLLVERDDFIWNMALLEK